MNNICDNCNAQSTYIVSYKDGFYCALCLVTTLEQLDAQYNAMLMKLEDQNLLLLTRTEELVEAQNEVEFISRINNKKCLDCWRPITKKYCNRCKARRQHIRLQSERNKAIVEMSKTMKVRDIAVKFGISSQSVYVILKQAEKYRLKRDPRIKQK